MNPSAGALVAGGSSGSSGGDGGVGGRILVVGDIVTDVMAVLAGPIVHASDTPASISVTGGGAGANTASWLAAGGAKVTLCGVVGTDEAGDARLAELAAHGVDLAIRRVPNAPTGSVVVLAERTERTMLTDRGANLRLSADDINHALDGAPDAVHLHLSGYPLLDDESRPAARHALTVAAARGLTTSVDAASAGPLRQVGGESFLAWVRATDLLFANVDEALALLETDHDLPSDLPGDLAGDARADLSADVPAGMGADRAADLAADLPGYPADDLADDRADDLADDRTAGRATDLAADPVGVGFARSLAAWVGVAVVKLGAAGAVSAALGGSEVAAVPATAAVVRDTTGAGDAFAAGYLTAWLAGARGRDALGAAVATAARAVASIGARPPRR